MTCGQAQNSSAQQSPPPSISSEWNTNKRSRKLVLHSSHQHLVSPESAKGCTERLTHERAEAIRAYDVRTDNGKSAFIYTASRKARGSITFMCLQAPVSRFRA